MKFPVNRLALGPDYSYALVPISFLCVFVFTYHFRGPCYFSLSLGNRGFFMTHDRVKSFRSSSLFIGRAVSDSTCPGPLSFYASLSVSPDPGRSNWCNRPFCFLREGQCCLFLPPPLLVAMTKIFFVSDHSACIVLRMMTFYVLFGPISGTLYHSSVAAPRLSSHSDWRTRWAFHSLFSLSSVRMDLRPTRRLWRISIVLLFSRLLTWFA